MKSVIITLIIGAAMIGGSIFYSSYLDRESKELSHITSDIKTCVLNDDFNKAQEKISELKKSVEHLEKIFLATGDHIEIDNIKIHLSELKSYAQHRMKSDAIGKIYVLDFLFDHLPRNSQIRIGYIL